MAKELKIQLSNLIQAEKNLKQTKKTKNSKKITAKANVVEIYKKDIKEKKDVLADAKKAIAAIQSEYDKTHDKLIALKSGHYLDEESNDSIIEREPERKEESKYDEEKESKPNAPINTLNIDIESQEETSSTNRASNKVIYYSVDNRGKRTYFEVSEKDLAVAEYRRMQSEQQMTSFDINQDSLPESQAMSGMVGQQSSWWNFGSGSS